MLQLDSSQHAMLSLLECNGELGTAWAGLLDTQQFAISNMLLPMSSVNIGLKKDRMDTLPNYNILHTGHILLVIQQRVINELL